MPIIENEEQRAAFQGFWDITYAESRVGRLPIGTEVPERFICDMGGEQRAIWDDNVGVPCYPLPLSPGDSTMPVRGAFTCSRCHTFVNTDLAVSHSRMLDPAGHVIYEDGLRVCGNCLQNYFLYSAIEDRWLNVEADSPVSVRDRDSAVSHAYAVQHGWYFDEASGYFYAEGRPAARLMSYDADPFQHFEWDSRNKQNALVFGVELEMEPLSGGSRAIISKLGGVSGENFILKHDGSLTDGVELVSMPFTLAQHLDGSGVPWQTMLPSLYDTAMSGRGTQHCGIHIHINKRALSALTIGKMLVFLNSHDMGTLVTAIAQRTSGSYCQRDSTKKLTDGTRSSANRYDIMNVSVRHPTCEVRMFRGNITLERLYKNLEFCHALVQYCRQASMRSLCVYGNFTDWLIRHRGEYPHLVRFLADTHAIGFRQLARDTRDGQVTIIDR